jgi:phytol kinase
MKESKLVFELKRKMIHFFALLYILIYIIVFRIFGQRIAILSIIFILIFFVVVEFFRITRKKKIPIFHVFWRAKEENSLGSQVYFTLGVIIVFAAFDVRIALAALCMTIFGDAAAAIFGIRFGKHWIKCLPETAWEGIIAEFVVDLVIGCIILSNIWIVIPMAIVATLVETVLHHVDDNLAIPVFSGFIGQVIKMIL